MDSINGKINFFQLNTDFSKASSLLLEKYFNDFNIDVALMQDIYCEKFGLLQKYKPPDFIGYDTIYFKESNTMPKVALYVKSNFNVTFLPQASNLHCITCILHLDNSEFVVLSSLYSPPPDVSPTIRTDILFNHLSTLQIQKLILCGDFNSHSSLWSNQSQNDRKGDDLEILLLHHDLTVLNDIHSSPTFENTRGGCSWIDISTAGSKVADKISDWKLHNEESLSFHKIITFSLSLTPLTDNKIRYNFEKTNWDIFNITLSDNFHSKNISEEKIQNAELCELDILAERISVAIKDTIISVVPSTTNYKNRVLVSWWSKEISIFRKMV